MNFAVLYCAASTVATPAAPAATATVPHLELHAELTDDHVLRGEAAWHIHNDGSTPVGEIHFILWANYEEVPNPNLSSIARASSYFHGWEPARTDIRSVTDESGASLAWRYVAAAPRTQTFSLERVYAVVTLPAPLLPGESTRIALRFETAVPHRIGDAGYFNGDTTWRFGWFPQPRHREADGQWSDAVVLTSFTHGSTLRVPAGMRAIIGADRCQIRDGETQASSPLPVRSVPIVVSDSLQEVHDVIEGVAVSVYAYGDAALFDTSKREAEQKLEQVRRMLPFYNKHYGSYRLHTLQIIETKSTFVSMAADGLILLSDLFFIYDSGWTHRGLFAPLGETILAHELAHLWWGIGAGVDFDTTNWLSEGFAQHLSLDYAESEATLRHNDNLDPNWFIQWAAANWGATALPARQLESSILPEYEDHVRDGLDEPLVIPQASLRHVEENHYRIYQKGALAARALRALLGDEATRLTLRRTYEETAGRMVTLHDLRRAAKSVAGIDIEEFFNDFVLGKARADVSVTGMNWEAATGQGTVHVRHEGDLTLPVEISVRAADREFPLRWQRPSGSAHIPFHSSVEPDEVVLDPRALVPDTQRRNNTWPRAVSFAWLEPQASTGAYTLAFNPTPVHRHYLLGVSFSGRDATQSAWHLGTGTTPFAVERAGQTEAAPGWKHTAYGEVYLQPARADAFTASVVADRLQLDGATIYEDILLGFGYSLPLFSATDVGATGITELPRTFLGISAFAYGRALREGSTIWHVEEEGGMLTAHRSVGLQLDFDRDETANYGFDVSVQAYGALDLESDEPFGQIECRTQYALAIHHVGYFNASLQLATVTAATPYGLRPELTALTLLGKTGHTPYEALAAAGANLIVPLARAMRVKNVLTLYSLVFNDIAIQFHGAIAGGGVWRGKKGQRLDMRDPLAEVGAGLRIGLAALGAPFNVVVGRALPVWPTPQKRRVAGTFLRLEAALP